MRRRGFTLVELLLVLTLSGTALTFSVQTFRQLVERHLLTQPLAEISGSLQFARAAAIGIRQKVSVCPSEDQHFCADNPGYEQGWIVFADIDNPGHRDPGEILLASKGALNPRVTLRSNTFSRFISFHADGRANTNGRFAICADRQTDNIAGIYVISSGRLRQAAANTITRCLLT